jgi:NADPH:quinone reductase-like Zn-dependent oxidoreductase
MLVGTVAGGSYELDARYMFGKRLTVRGTALRARSLEEKIQVTQSFASEVVPLLASGTLRTVIDSVFPLADIAKAHTRLESNETFGKVVLTVD